MANLGSFKWGVLLVACVALYVYQKGQSQQHKSPFGKAIELERMPSEEGDGVYTTTVPARDIHSVDHQMLDDTFLQDPIQNAPIQNAPIQNAPIQNTPMQNVPMQNALMQNAPMQDAPMQNVSIRNQFEDMDSSQMPELDQLTEVMPEVFEQGMEDELFEFESQESIPAELEQMPVRMEPQVSLPQHALELPSGVKVKAVQQIEYGKSLARRGAAFGAKNSFHDAMRLIAQAHDYQTGSQGYTDSLHRATVALKDADDFFFAQGESNGRVDVASIARNHELQILSVAQMEQMTPVQAMQEYYNYVRKNLAAAGGNSIVASEAMFCLGKLYLVKGKDIIEGSPLDNAKAIVHHRAALECNDNNYKSANELAVLLAKTGRLDQAKNLLLHSLKIQQVPQAWENLAFIHQQLGENQLAQLASNEFQRMMNSPPSTQQINWVAPEQFANGGSEPAALRTAMHEQQAPVNTGSQQESKFKTILKKMF